MSKRQIEQEEKHIKRLKCCRKIKRGIVTRHSSNGNATDRPEEGSALQVFALDETSLEPNCMS